MAIMMIATVKRKTAPPVAMPPIAAPLRTVWAGLDVAAKLGPVEAVDLVV